MKEKRRKGYEQREAEERLKKRARKTADVPQRAQKKQTGRTSAEKSKKRARNKEFARVTYSFVALFIAMMGYIS